MVSGRVEVEGIMLPKAAGAIAASSFVVLDFAETSPYDAYAPYDKLHIFNDSNSLLEVRPNQRRDKPHFVAGKTEKIISDINLYTVYIGELSGTAIPATGPGSVRLVVERSPIGADEFYKRMARKVGGLFGR